MIQQVFSEYEAYREAHEDIDMSLTLCHPERSRWSLCHLYVDSLHIQSGSDGCGDIAEGATRRDGWILYYQRGGIPQLANGERLTQDSVVVAGPGAEFCLTSQGCHDWTSVFFPAASLFPSVDEEPLGGLRVVRPGLSLAGRLQRKVGRFVAAAKADRSVTTEAASVAAFREELHSIARRIIGAPLSRNVASTRFVHCRYLVSEAIEQLEMWPNLSPTIGELSRRIRVSERTLRAAFTRSLGMSPYQYLVTVRLNHARQLLLKGDPDELTVRAVASRVGFWDFGRFASKYRKLFGELPSETLQRNRAGA